MAEIHFKINGVQHTVGCEVSSDVTLLDFIRDTAELRGTKYMCREAGCGACIVTAIKCAGTAPIGVNACMISVLSCQDWEITTVEKVGNKLDGYDPIQTTLAELNGTQCGYCTPGWIMAMYSLMQANNNLTMLDIEKSFGSNVCRCTGYRPILEAFKKFAKDAPIPARITDIEDLHICKKNGKVCDKKKSCNDEDWCIISEDDLNDKLKITPEMRLVDGKKWFRPQTVAEIFLILLTNGNDDYMLVAGNTAKGAYPIEEYPRILIDISAIDALKGFIVDQNLVVGAGNSLSDIMEAFKHFSTEPYFEYLQKLYDHLSLVAHIPVRNVGTIAGNLMIKHAHNEFASDVFLLLETVGAQLTIVDSLGIKHFVTMQQFLRTNMRGKVILNAMLPPLSSEYKMVSFKIMPRSQSAHAIVNCGFLFKISAKNNTLLECRIVYGGLSSNFIRASATEAALVGKDLFKNETLQLAINSLKNELIVDEEPTGTSVAHRRQLAINLLYKGLLRLCPQNTLDARFRSGPVGIKESRPVSDARQIFDTDPTLWPLNQPVQKLEALIQCSGEAPYTEDLPSFPREVYAAFVLSTVAKGDIVNMDASRALKQRGVLAFYSAKDIPGVNAFTPGGTGFYPIQEEILCSGSIKHYNQPIGIIVAETRAIADRAAKMVDVTYINVKKPLIDIKEAKKVASRNTEFASIDAIETGTDVTKVIKGSNTIYEQYFFTMETLVCVTKPIEEGLEVHAASQFMDLVQEVTAKSLNMDINRVDVHVRRVGGGFGFKISRETQVAVACSLVAKKLNRPCRFIQSLSTNMRAMGKRFPCSTDFEIGVNTSGVIQFLNYNLYEDNGYAINEPVHLLGLDLHNNCYNNSRWNYKGFNTLTDNTKHTFCRSPGTLECIAMAEYLMEQISYELSLDPVAVRLANLDETNHGVLKEMVETLKTNSQYNDRRTAVDKYNKDNRWKKRGLRFSFLRWTPFGIYYLDINVSIYHGDGSVVITHGGIEMGQGVNTKAAQIAAYFLKIPMSKIQVKGNNTIIAPNGFVSGGSVTSSNVGIGVQRACEELMSRLEPVRAQMNNPTWEELIANAFNQQVDLQAHGFLSAADILTFHMYGVALAEVEVDVLTGEFEIIRVDLLQDVGRSVSPEIDVGQVEGAFIMGLGYWTSENLIYDQQTGELLTNRAWNYYVPQARDIPQDFRVYFKKNSYSTDAVLGSKMTGEPPMCLSVVLPFAIREALAAARLECNIPTTTWFPIDGSYTVEKILLAAATKTEHFKYYN